MKKAKIIFVLMIPFLYCGLLSSQTITIPVVVHVIWYNVSQNISDAQVQSQIEVLNEDFGRTNIDTINTPAAFAGLAANTEIQFCLAQTDPNGLPTTGIIHKQTFTSSFSSDNKVKQSLQGGDNAWDVTRYFNIWVCNLNGGLIGYGEFPTSTISNTYGVVIHYSFFGRTGAVSYPYDKGRSCTHEVGHCFNLYNLVGNPGCIETDSVSDTPTPSGNNYGCSSYPLLDACNPTAPGVMFMNFMTYSDDSCMNMFTYGQKTRMHAMLNTSPYNALPASTTCLPVGINEIKNDFYLSFFPNPAGNEIRIKLNKPLGKDAYISILNSIGEEVLKRKVYKMESEVKLDVAAFPTGMYFVKVNGYSGKFVKN
ncbi:MAG: M43 family zinc metalloprotease [Bacteroidota bacterium]